MSSHKVYLHFTYFAMQPSMFQLLLKTQKCSGGGRLRSNTELAVSFHFAHYGFEHQQRRGIFRSITLQNGKCCNLWVFEGDRVGRRQKWPMHGCVLYDVKGEGDGGFIKAPLN